MSNTESSLKKVIQLKQIQRPVVEEPVNYEAQLQLELSKLKEVKNELEAIKKERESMIADTENQILLAKENWEQEKIQLIEQAKQKGYQAGFEQGKNESLEQFSHLITQANGIINDAKKDYLVTVEKSEETILKLAVHVAEKIMRQQLADNPEFFVPIVKEAISSIKDQRELSIYLHPDNYESVLSQKSELERILDSRANLSIYLNEALEKDSCLIEHPFGKIDASIHTQLNKIHQVLYEIVMEQKE
ncbi:flagellar assembly protein FliH [Ornithinibacillus sp. 179-J 7C1 HS]|uniref:flagellar assembly protein FliH n=1 Tax=Ornithinibacillus sp. 179-J 7C1 HS TaxID=3142384 RepID=UPI0039A19FA2